MTPHRPVAPKARSSRRDRRLFTLALAGVAVAAAVVALSVDSGPGLALHPIAAPAHARALSATHSLADESVEGSIPDVFRHIRAVGPADSAPPIPSAETWPAP